MIDNILSSVSLLTLQAFMPPMLLPAFKKQAGYQIARSLRFNSADSAYLTRTPSTSGTGAGRIWTLHFKIKRTTLGTAQFVLTALSAPAASNRSGIGFFTASGGASDSISLYHSANFASRIESNAVFRDPTAWYEFTIAVNTTLSTPSDRVKIYVNNEQITSFSTASYPAQNYQFGIGLNVPHWIGSEGAATGFLDALLADVHFVDGLQLDPTYFGQTDKLTNAWVPKKYTGTYGTNGFHLDFSDNSNTTSSTLGKDRSGNDNDWTPNNFSVAAGADNDSLTDTPTNYGTDTGVGGEVRGNYATFDLLWPSPAASVRDGGLALVGTGGGLSYVSQRASWPAELPIYWETIAPANVSASFHGIVREDSLATAPSSGNPIGFDAVSYPGSVGIRINTGAVYINGSLTATYSAFSSGNIIRHAFDPTTGKYWIGNASGWFNSGNPASGTNPVATVSTSNKWRPAISEAGTQSVYINFGQRPFAHTAPSGFKCLCTQNLTDTTVALPATFTGNANANGPFVWANGVVETVTINGNVATEGTHFRKVAGGIKIITSSASYNSAGSNTITTATYGVPFKYARAV